MARIARVVVKGLPHHIVQRGNRRQTVFFNEVDRKVYLSFLRTACEKYGVHIWAWCLMTNHVHFIAVPEKEDSFSKCFSDTHVRYTRRINSREGWKGHLWQGRFGSSPLDEPYLLTAVRYVERNPVRAKIIEKPWEYRWSSAAYHSMKVQSDPIVNNDKILMELIGDWKAYLREAGREDEMLRIRRESSSGRPVGDVDFIKVLEKTLNRVLIRGRPGRRLRKKQEI